jgi:2-keto-3-deoxy-L-fuconate dehydrogenase
MFSLQQKVAVITGGGSGIGQAIARTFASQGAEIVILDLNETGASQTVAEIIKNGGKAVFYRCDVSDQTETGRVFDLIPKADILVNSAGVSHIGKIENTTETDFDRIFRVNVKGVYNCMLLAERWRSHPQLGFHRFIGRHSRPVRLFHEQGSRADHDAFGGAGLS